MMPPRSVYLNCNRSFHTLWARCFEGGGNVRSVQLYVCVCVVLHGVVLQGVPRLLMWGVYAVDRACVYS